MILRAWFFIALSGVSFEAAHAQRPPNLDTLDAGTAYDLASRWISDGDPRLRAWGAELIAKYQLSSLYPDLASALTGFNPSERFSGTPEEFALEAVADALITAHVPVPASDARKLFPEFPALAMILLSASADDNRAALLSILDQSKSREVWLASANLLARNPSPGLVIKLLDDFEVFVTILVFEPGTGGGMSGDCYGPKELPALNRPDDWPPISIYSLQIAKKEGTTISSGINSVSFTNRVTRDVNPWQEHAGCSLPSLQELREGIILQLAGIDPAITALRAVVLTDIVRKADDQYRQDAIGILQQQAQSFAQVVAQLQSKGLITPAQAAERRLHMQVHIVPSRRVQALPALPDLQSLGITGQYSVATMP